MTLYFNCGFFKVSLFIEIVEEYVVGDMDFDEVAVGMDFEAADVSVFACFELFVDGSSHVVEMGYLVQQAFRYAVPPVVHSEECAVLVEHYIALVSKADEEARFAVVL